MFRSYDHIHAHNHGKTRHKAPGHKKRHQQPRYTTPPLRKHQKHKKPTNEKSEVTNIAKKVAVGINTKNIDHKESMTLEHNGA
jgi:hypothetical protein